jgi:hypothetical protein
MSSINSNAGVFNAQNSSIVPIVSDDLFNGIFSSCLNFSVIEVSVKTDTIYNLSIAYSPDGINDEFTQLITLPTASTDTLFYKFEPKMRYFRIILENVDAIDQTFLSLQCLLKSSFVYLPAASIGDAVSIVSPVDGDGYVEVSVMNEIVISGSVNVDNFPATQAVSGSVNVDNFPASQVISGSVNVDNFPASQVISGSVNVDNFPASQVISGSVNVDNFPASQVISGSVNVDNFPASQVISGSVNVDNFPASQVISGSVNVDNFPASQEITNSDISTIANSLNNQRISVPAWNNVSVAQNGVSSAISPGTSTYCNTTLSCYGTSSQNAVIGVQFSNNGSTFYTTQYQYTLTAGDFGFSIACSAYHIRLILLSATTSTITAYIDVC